MFTIILIQIESKVYLDFYIFYSSFVLFVHKISCFMRCFSSHSCEIISAFFAAAASEKQTITAAMIIIIKTYAWIRLHGKAVFENNMAAKEMCIANPIVKGQYQTADNPIFEVFYLENAHGLIADFSGNPPYEF